MGSFANGHRTLAMMCSAQGAPFHSWGKSGELDKLLVLLMEQIDGPVSALTRTKRIQGVLHYLGAKSAIIDNGMFENVADGKARADAMAWTLNNSLARYDAIPFGLSGRFHRVFMATYYETTSNGGVASEKAVMELWINQIANRVRVYFNYDVPPVAAEMTFYRINSDATQINDGSDITVSTGDRLRLFSSGIGYESKIWQQDSVDITGETADLLNIDSVVAGDAGVYEKTFTNSAGTTSGPAFTVVVS